MKFPFHFEENVPLAPLATFGIGGKARYFVSTDSPEKLIEVINFTREKHIPYRLFAGGSNVVFPDEGLDCLVIRVLGGITSVEGSQLTVDAGVLLSEVILRAINNGLSGLEMLSGIPGTVGGAVVGNAGAYGHSISEVIENVELFDGKTARIMGVEECRFRYRNSIFKGNPWIVLRVTLKFENSDSDNLKNIFLEIIKEREAKYRPGLKCPGSFFKNILVSEVDPILLSRIDQNKIIEGKIPACFLLDTVGARGMRVGEVEIASFHGNLFINRGNGKAHEVIELAEILKEKVKKRFDILLEEEIRYF